MAVLIDKVGRGQRDEKIEQICASFDNQADALLEILHAVQAEFGYVSDLALPVIGTCLNLSRADVYGVVSFYHDFNRKAQTKPVIFMCRAESCQALGAEALAQHGQIHAAQVEIRTVYCLGNCGLGPSVMVDGKVRGRIGADQLDTIVAKLIGAMS